MLNRIIVLFLLILNLYWIADRVWLYYQLENIKANIIKLELEK